MLEAQLLAQRYELQEKIGKGGMATIFKALDHRASRIVAIKLLHETFQNDASFVARFQREAKAAASLNNQHIVQVYDYGQSNESYYIIMEYVPGTDLRRYLHKERILPIATAIRITRNVAQGLAAAHRRGIIHRDIKPQNILLDENHEAKLTDFGIAHVFEDNTGERLTTAGTTVGTVQYYAPEQARGELPTPAVDVYALGIVLYEMVTGRLPFEAESAIALAMKHLTEPPIPPSRYNAAIPRALEAIILQCLSKRAIDRFPDGAALYNALTRLERPSSPIAPAVPRSDPTEELAVVKSERSALKRTQPFTVTSQSITRLPRRPAPPQRFGATGCALAAIGATIFLILALVSLFLGQQLPIRPSRPVEDPTATTQTSPTRVVVPRFRGLSVEKARRVAQNYNLVLVEDQFQASSSPAGIVIRQSPAPGSSVPKGSAVHVLVSSGESKPTSTPVAQVVVPDVAHRQFSEAQAVLERAGLLVKADLYFSINTPANEVIDQHPDPGTRVPSGSVVTLVVSKGPNPAATPTPLPTVAPTLAPTAPPATIPPAPTTTPAPFPTPPVPTATVLSQPVPVLPPLSPTSGKKHKP